MADDKNGSEGSAIPQRPLGRTGVLVSALGIGGHHLGDFKGVEDAIRLVHEAVDAGVTFCDNCWEYWNGRAEDWMGRALQGRRDKVFLMTKVCTHGRGANLAMKMLDESLRRLKNRLSQQAAGEQAQAGEENQSHRPACRGWRPSSGFGKSHGLFPLCQAAHAGPGKPAAL